MLQKPHYNPKEKSLLIASTTTEMTALQRPAHWQSVFPPFFFHPAHALISAGGDDDEEEEKERPKEG